MQFFSKPFKLSKPHGHAAGLTMSELLVAMTIMVVLFLALYQVFTTGLNASVDTSTRAELDTETQKVQQLVLNRIKEADRFVDRSAVTFADPQSSGQTGYLPASSLPAQQMVIVRLPSKNSPNMCDLYAYYVVPSSNLASTSMPIHRRLAQATFEGISLIEGKTSSSFDCTLTTYPSINQLRLLHPSLAPNTGFVAKVYPAVGTQKGIVFSLQGHRKAANKTITASSYQVKVLARNL